MQIIGALFPLIALISLGFALKHRQFVADEFWRGAERLNYFILFPILLFSNLAFVELKLTDFSGVLQVVVLTTLCVSLLFWILKYSLKIPVARFGVYVQSHIRFNTYIGLSLMGLLFAVPGMQMFSVIIAVIIPIVNIISVLAFMDGQPGQLKRSVLALFKNPLILGCAAGITFNALDLSIFLPVHQLLKLLAACSLPLGLLSVGAALQFQSLRSGFKALIFNSLGRLVIVPLCAYGMCQLFGLSQFETMVVTVFFALPTASAAYMLTRYMHGDAALMAGVISLQTLLFMLSFPVLMWCLTA